MPAQSLGHRAWARIGSARHLYTHRGILYRVTRNEISSRYAGSLLGAAWVFLAPLLLLSVYSLVYLEIFRLRLPGLSQGEYVVFIFAGLVPYLATAEAIAGGVSAVVANKAVLSNTVFPIDLTPVKAVLISLGTMTVGLTIVVIGTAVTGNIGLPILFLPFVLLMHVLMLIGIVWIISLLNVVFRDIQNLVAVSLMILLIASPIAYAPQMVPGRLRPFLELNPFSYYIFAYQKATILDEYPSPYLISGLVVLSVGTFLIGSWFFDRAKRVIIDYV